MGYRALLSVSALCVVTFVTAEESPSASDCTFQHIDAVAGCEAIAAFAKCLASTRKDDPNKQSAFKALTKAEETTPGCDITVTPTLSVVDREVSVEMSPTTFLLWQHPQKPHRPTPTKTLNLTHPLSHPELCFLSPLPKTLPCSSARSHGAACTLGLYHTFPIQMVMMLFF
jgi:hypothetical protein